MDLRSFFNNPPGWLKPLTVGFVCTLLTGISYGFGMFLFPMVMPEMIRDLQLTYTHAGIITSVSQVAPLLTVPLAGYLTYRFGGLRFIVYCQILGAILLMALYFVQGFTSLIIVYFIVRGWPIMIWIPLVSIATEHIDFKWRATMFMVASSSGCFFIFVDGVLSSYFLKHYHWRSLWLTVGMMCLASSLISWIALKLVNAWAQGSVQEEVKQHSNAKLIKWMKSRSGIILNLLFIIIGFSFLSFQMYLAPFLRDEQNMGLDLTAVMWSIIGISGVLGGIGIGLITDRFGVRFSFVFIFMMAIVSTILICLPLNPVYILTMAVLFGIASATIYGMGPAYISKTLDSESAAKAFTIGNIGIIIGSLIGNFVGGWSEGSLGSFWWFYVSLGVLFVVGAVISLALKSEQEGLEA